jgi:hypothetical protein
MYRKKQQINRHTDQNHQQKNRAALGQWKQSHPFHAIAPSVKMLYIKVIKKDKSPEQQNQKVDWNKNTVDNNTLIITAG